MQIEERTDIELWRGVFIGVTAILSIGAALWVLNWVVVHVRFV